MSDGPEREARHNRAVATAVEMASRQFELDKHPALYAAAEKIRFEVLAMMLERDDPDELAPSLASIEQSMEDIKSGRAKDAEQAIRAIATELELQVNSAVKP